MPTHRQASTTNTGLPESSENVAWAVHRHRRLAEREPLKYQHLRAGALS